MDFYGLLVALRMGWISIDIFGFLWIISSFKNGMDINLWIFMDFYGLIIYDVYGLLALMCLVNYLLILGFYYLFNRPVNNNPLWETL